MRFMALTHLFTTNTFHALIAPFAQQCVEFPKAYIVHYTVLLFPYT